MVNYQYQNFSRLQQIFADKLDEISRSGECDKYFEDFTKHIGNFTVFSVKINPITDVKIEELDFSPSLKELLFEEGITLVAQLLEYTERELRWGKLFYYSSVRDINPLRKEVIEKIKAAGFVFKKELDSNTPSPEEVSLDDLPLSTRPYNLLKSKQDITSLAQLLDCSIHELHETSGAGEKSIIEIINVVKHFGYSLRIAKGMNKAKVKKLSAISKSIKYALREDK